MLQEAVDELVGREGDAVQLLAAVVAIAKSHLPIFKALQLDELFVRLFDLVIETSQSKSCLRLIRRTPNA